MDEINGDLLAGQPVNKVDVNHRNFSGVLDLLHDPADIANVAI
jgi:hypothetical protein